MPGFRTGLLAAAVLLVFVLTLMVGRTFYGPGDVLGVVLGQDVRIVDLGSSNGTRLNGARVAPDVPVPDSR